MALVWGLLILAAVYLVYGAVVRSPFQRVFPADLTDAPAIDGYLQPQEVIDPDEVALADRVSAAIAADSLRRPKHAGRDDPMFYEPHWGHTSALLAGTLRIDPDALPPQFRVGLFTERGNYPVVARSGVTRDPDLGFAVHRLALKLRYPTRVPNVYAANGDANELDLLLVAGAGKEHPASHAFFARDARQLDMATRLKPPSLDTVKTFANWRNVAMLLDVLGTVRRLMAPLRQAPATRTGWAGRPYFSLGPFALGDGVMKFNLSPVQTHDVADADPMKGDLARRALADMDGWMAGGRDAEFTLGVQLATPDCIPNPGPGDPPKSVMAAEYCDLQWDENVSPYIPVGTLTLRSDGSVNQPSSWVSLQFNAWNTLPEMRPLGQLFRIRKTAHEAHSNVRVGHLYGGTPGEMVGKCPFSG